MLRECLVVYTGSAFHSASWQCLEIDPKDKNKYSLYDYIQDFCFQKGNPFFLVSFWPKQDGAKTLLFPSMKEGSRQKKTLLWVSWYQRFFNSHWVMTTRQFSNSSSYFKQFKLKREESQLTTLTEMPFKASQVTKVIKIWLLFEEKYLP